MFDDFYGFEARPFQLTPDPAFYFESLTHRKAMSYLGYGMAQGEGFVVITGEVGAGKSTLVAYLMNTIDPNQMTAATVVTSALDGSEIIHVVAQAFGLEVEGHDKAAALGLLERFLHDEARAGRRTLLVVDEAQNLKISALEELRMLSNFQLGSHPLLQTLLLGQPEFRTTLLESDQLEQLRQRVIATHHLGEMQSDEIQPYVEHRLACVGWRGDPSFDPDIFAQVHKATAGIPRRINQIFNRLLLLGSVDQRHHIDAPMLEQVFEELADDGAISLVTDQAVKFPHSSTAQAFDQVAQAMRSQGGAAPVSAPAGHDTQVLIDTALAQSLADRDEQIHELQSAVVELAARLEGLASAPVSPFVQAVPHDDATLVQVQAQLEQVQARATALEARLVEQERTLRHTLTMLIEWIENSKQTPKIA